jgi:hypothetical protein
VSNRGVRVGGGRNAGHGKRTRIDDLRGPELAGEHGSSAESHLAVRQRGPVLDHEHAPAGDALRAIRHHGRRGLHDAGIGVRGADVTAKLLGRGEIRRVHLVQRARHHPIADAVSESGA